MARIPREPEPFFKWDPDGHAARSRADARRQIQGERPDDDAEKRQRAKRWLLRWAWAISTGVLILGYLIMLAVLTDHQDLIGL